MLNENEEAHYIEEPVNELINAINGSPNNIILTGARYSGKTLVVKKLMKQNRKKNVEYIYFKNCLDLTGHGLYEDGLIHLFELMIYGNAIHRLDQQEMGIIKKIREKYGYDKETGKLPPEAMEELKNFAELRDDIKGLLPNYEKMRESFYMSIRNGIKEGYDYFKFGEISQKVIDIFKKHCTSIQVVFDRFESSGPLLVQKTIFAYTKLFDKSIIVVDENTLGDNDKEFQKRGYDIFRTDYAKDRDFIYKYICFRFRAEMQEYMIKRKKTILISPDFNLTSLMTEEDKNKISEEGNGDLELVNSIIGHICFGIISDDSEWQQDPDFIRDSIRGTIYHFNEVQNYERTHYPIKSLTLFKESNM